MFFFQFAQTNEPNHCPSTFLLLIEKLILMRMRRNWKYPLKIPHLYKGNGNAVWILGIFKKGYFRCLERLTQKISHCCQLPLLLLVLWPRPEFSGLASFSLVVLAATLTFGKVLGNFDRWKKNYSRSLRPMLHTPRFSWF